MRTLTATSIALAAVAASQFGCRVAPPRPPVAPVVRSPLTLTYLGVAGWQLEADGHTLLVDPYFSRPDLEQPIVPDAAAIAAHTPAHVDAILIGHSHVDHLLDAPTLARATGAQLIGSASTAAVGRASGVPDDQLVTVRGGEDFQFDGWSVKVLPSLHSALDHKHAFGTSLTGPPTLPMRFDDYAEGGTFAYLVRLGGHEVLILDTANYIERELIGLHPDVAIVATGLREEIHDYTCRLMRAVGAPPRVYANHFDDWRGAPTDVPPTDDLAAFVAEVHACAPATTTIVPHHFEAMTIP